MNLDVVDNDAERKFFASLNIIIDHGAYADQQKGAITLGEEEQARKKTFGPETSITNQWGPKFQMGDCDTYRCALGPLVFISHNFGEWL